MLDIDGIHNFADDNSLFVYSSRETETKETSVLNASQSDIVLIDVG